MLNDNEIQAQAYYNHHCIVIKNMKTGKEGIKKSNGEVVLAAIYDNITICGREVIAKINGRIENYIFKNKELVKKKYLVYFSKPKKAIDSKDSFAFLEKPYFDFGFEEKN